MHVKIFNTFSDFVNSLNEALNNWALIFEYSIGQWLFRHMKTCTYNKISTLQTCTNTSFKKASTKPLHMCFGVH